MSIPQQVRHGQERQSWFAPETSHLAHSLQRFLAQYSLCFLLITLECFSAKKKNNNIVVEVEACLLVLAGVSAPQRSARHRAGCREPDPGRGSQATGFATFWSLNEVPRGSGLTGHARPQQNSPNSTPPGSPGSAAQPHPPSEPPVLHQRPLTPRSGKTRRSRVTGVTARPTRRPAEGSSFGLARPAAILENSVGARAPRQDPDGRGDACPSFPDTRSATQCRRRSYEHQSLRKRPQERLSPELRAQGGASLRHQPTSDGPSAGPEPPTPHRLSFLPPSKPRSPVPVHPSCRPHSCRSRAEHGSTTWAREPAQNRDGTARPGTRSGSLSLSSRGRGDRRCRGFVRGSG